MESRSSDIVFKLKSLFLLNSCYLEDFGFTSRGRWPGCSSYWWRHEASSNRLYIPTQQYLFGWPQCSSFKNPLVNVSIPSLVFLSQFDIPFVFPFTEIYSTCFGIVFFLAMLNHFFRGCQVILLIFIFSKSKKIIGIVIQKSTHYNNPFPCGFYNLRNENVMHELQNYQLRYKSRIKDILMLNQSVNI